MSSLRDAIRANADKTDLNKLDTFELIALEKAKIQQQDAQLDILSQITTRQREIAIEIVSEVDKSIVIIDRMKPRVEGAIVRTEAGTKQVDGLKTEPGTWLLWVIIGILVVVIVIVALI